MQSLIARYGVCLVAFAFVVGCSKGAEQKPGQQPIAADKLDLDEVKAELSRAAGGPTEEFEILALAGPIPSVDKFDNQSLSAVVLSLPATEDDDPSQDVRFAEQPNPVKIAAAMVASKAKGYCSILQPAYITKVAFDDAKDAAQGSVEFAVKDVCEGKLNFVAAPILDDPAIFDVKSLDTELPQPKSKR